MKNSIGHSELILTAHGAVYHLHLTPAQLADTVICVGDPGLAKKISGYFDRIEHNVQHREFATRTGYLGSKRISVISTGNGPANMDIIMNELDALANINFHTRTISDRLASLHIIRLGTSDSIQPDIHTDSFVVSDFAIGLDNLLSFYQYENNAEELELLKKFEEHIHWARNKEPYIASSSRRLSNHFQNNYHHGITVTSPGYFAPQGRTLRAPACNTHFINAFTSFNHNIRIANMEMETAAFYALGKILGHHCLSVSAVIHNRIRKEFSADINKTMEKMIKEVLAVVEKI